jgi:hypothetical protein
LSWIVPGVRRLWDSMIQMKGWPHHFDAGSGLGKSVDGVTGRVSRLVDRYSYASAIQLDGNLPMLIYSGATLSIIDPPPLYTRPGGVLRHS